MTPLSGAHERLSIVIVGHVDHGKSTVVGRMLADTGSLPRGKLELIKDFCARNARAFEYAFLLDALRDEQNQGITIDAARVFFRTARRDYLIIDAPGHIEFLKNMISGASHASAALLVIDANEGIKENTRRHAYLLSLLGVAQVAVLVNKMDLVGYREDVFRELSAQCRAFLKELDVTASCFIPTSAIRGENIAVRSTAMPWYSGQVVIDVLDSFKNEPAATDKPFRLPVQDVYKFTALGDDRRIIVGTVESGVMKVSDELVFLPSGKASSVKSIESFPSACVTTAGPGQAVGFTLSEQLYIQRGEIAVIRGQKSPPVGTRLRASVFWLGREPLSGEREYGLKIGTARARARLEKVVRILDVSSLQILPDRTFVSRHEVAECLFALDKPLVLEAAEDNFHRGRFVLVDGYEIGGGGLVREVLEDKAARVRDQVILRDIRWRKGAVSLPEREERMGQRAGLILVTGSDEELRRATAKGLERRLFAEGRFVYFLGIGSVLYGLGADLREGTEHAEDIRRLAEAAHLLLDAGLLLVVTASKLKPEDCDMIRTIVEPARIAVAWIGPGALPGLPCDIVLDRGPVDTGLERIMALLAQKGMLRS